MLRLKPLITAIPTVLEIPRLPEATDTAPPHKQTASATLLSELGNTILQENSLTLGHVEKFCTITRV